MVAAAGFAVPLALGLMPWLRVPAVVLEIVAGIVIGPSVLGWVQEDAAIEVLSTVGLAFLLFLAGLEVRFDRLRGALLGRVAASFALSFALALGLSFALRAAGLVESPLLVAIILCATSLGIVVPVLKDAGRASGGLGQVVIAAGTVADFGAVILLTLFFSQGASGPGAQAALLGIFVVLALGFGTAVAGAERSERLSTALLRLQDTTAQIRVRGAFLLLLVFAAFAELLGLEVILGAFAAGAALVMLDRDRAMTHPDLRVKLDAVGYGVFIPVFFVTSGVRFDAGALFAETTTLALVPLFLAALLAARGLPAIVYRGLLDSRQMAVAGLMQATSLPFIVAATQIGIELGVLDAAVGAALVAAGLVSVLVFPLAALGLLRGSPAETEGADCRVEGTSPDPPDRPAIDRTWRARGRTRKDVPNMKALMLNCTLKRSPAASNTQALMDHVAEVLSGLDVESETVRVVDHHIPFGVSSDEGDGDEWPPILEKVLAAEILIVGMPIWFGVRSSVCQLVMERLDGTYNTTNEVGQYPLYNTVAGVVVTGNEDGAHDCAATTLFNLSHLGCTIPPNADTYWVGEAGPGPSFLEANGIEHPYTHKTAGWMAHNVVHFARMLRDRPIPPEGNCTPCRHVG